MPFYAKLAAAVDRTDSLLCVGLDPSPERLPERYRSDTTDPCADLLRWNLALIEETLDLACCYKPNIAFYEAMGMPGMALLRDTLAAIPDHTPVLLDAKRGDMGSTSVAYARACFEQLDVDGVTLNPYLGRDSVEPFAAYEGRGLFVLCHTSNPSAEDFQTLSVARGDGAEPTPLYLYVARRAVSWSPAVGLVIGATYPDAVARVRAEAAETWFLLPGIGAQQGDLEACLAGGLRPDGGGLLVASSREIGQADKHGQVAGRLRERINRARDRGGNRG